MDLLIIDFFFGIQLSKRTCSVSLSFLFACGADLFVFLPCCFSCFFARYIDCVHHRSMWVFFFFLTKGNVHGYVFLAYAFSHQFSRGHGQGV